MDLNLGCTALILAECKARGLLRNQAAYVLATAYWETARTMQPVEEAFWLSDEWRRKNLRYYPWHGRGFVQLTWERNYIAMGARLGVDLTTDPSAAMEPNTAAKVLVVGMIEGTFTGRKLGEYVTLKASDFVGARRVVNGVDKAQAIAEIARDYDAALLAEGYGVEQRRVPIANEKRDGSAPRETPAQSATVQASAGQIAAGGTGAVGAVALLDGTAQIVALCLCGAVVLLAAWIMRERLRKWAEGDR